MPSVMGYYGLIYSNKPDIIHVFWGHYPSMIGILIKRFCPGIILTQFLGTYDLLAEYPGSIYLSKYADGLITHSVKNVSIMHKLGINTSKIKIIYRGVLVKEQLPDLLEKYGRLNTPAFMTASRMVKEKGGDDVMKIFAEIIKYYPAAKLYVIGSGNYKSVLEKKATDTNMEKSIIFIEHVPQTELIKMMSKVHFFILMSRSIADRLPNVLKEAMLQQCVAVTTNTDGIEELIDDGLSGIITHIGDINLAAKEIINCIRNPDIAILMAKNAREVIKNKFDVKKSMLSYADLWNDLLKSKSSVEL
jgi:glycosyltransferase involved in cell wall biosynthesis